MDGGLGQVIFVLLTHTAAPRVHTSDNTGYAERRIYRCHHPMLSTSRTRVLPVVRSKLFLVISIALRCLCGFETELCRVHLKTSKPLF